VRNCHARTGRDCLSTAYIDLNRVCMNSRMCNDLMKRNNDHVNTIDAVGCVTRAILEPSNYFRKKLKIPFKIGTREPKNMTISEIEDFFKSNYVITIHMRLGDRRSFSEDEFLVDFKEKPSLNNPFRCAQTIESFVQERFMNEDGLKRKKVYWFLTSDSESFKLEASKIFGGKIVTIELPPKHIAQVDQNHKDDLFHTLAEWYILGLSQKLILNFFEKSMFSGRVSGFSKSSWVYHLKHLFYNAATCEMQTFRFDGTWIDIRTDTRCGSFQTISASRNYRNQHLQRLREKHLHFPSAWVEHGKIMIEEDEDT